MDWLQEILTKLIKLMGFEDFSINYDPDRSRFMIFINNLDSEELTWRLINDLNHLAKTLTKKQNQQSVFIDINNYREKREGLIIELARATARKVVATKTELTLPFMNAYERRLIHLELSSRPDVKTESIGEGKERKLIIKPID
ncbi:MAG: R3H domain-containing nucleic acid-binding protein [Candidatus Paceibacterota bacterium]|jgi:spoIIIJ-associated protein